MDNPDRLNKLNKIFDDRIEFHMELVNIHTKKISNLQKKRLTQIKDLLKENNVLITDCDSTQSKIKDLLNENNELDDELFDSLHGDTPVELALSCDLGLTSDLGLGDQDLIWDRIRQSQLKQEVTPDLLTPMETNVALKSKILTDSPTTESVGATVLEKSENNLQIEPIIDAGTLASQVLTASDLKTIEDTPDPIITPPKINALFKVTPKTRKNIIKDIFEQATENINKLRKFDDAIYEDFDNFVQKEADRLLDVYLKTH